MPITPNGNSHLSKKINKPYEFLELAILSYFVKILFEDSEKEDEWSYLKNAETYYLRYEIANYIKKTQVSRKQIVDDVIKFSYFEGASQFKKEAKKIKVLSDEVTSPNIRNLIFDVNNLLDIADNRVLRQSLDAYRDIISNTYMNLKKGNVTLEQAIQKSVNKFADRGIASFVDKAGRQWDMAAYSEMALRTATMKSNLQGFTDMATFNGYDLVIVTDHADECPLCRPWENRILSISGSSDKYDSLDEAIGSGLFHPNCMHDINLWHGEASAKSKISYEDHDNQAGYEAKQRQRYMERQVRHWKRRQAVAVLPEDKKKATLKVKDWQAQIRTHINKHNLKRRYEREKIYKAD